MVDLLIGLINLQRLEAIHMINGKVLL